MTATSLSAASIPSSTSALSWVPGGEEIIRINTFSSVLLPFAAYASLALAAFAASSHTHGALFAVGAAVLLLLFIGIHNAWDSVTYIAMERVRRDAAKQ